MSKPCEKLILGLETGLDGGSVSILRNGKQIDFAVGEGNVSKSEDLLLLIESLLKKNGINKREIGLIAVSTSPGSLTGIRIGLALAKGLGDSLSADVRRCSILEALASLVNVEGRIVSAIHTKKGNIYFSEYQKSGNQYFNKSEFLHQKSNSDEMIDELRRLKNQNVSVVLNEELKIVLSDLLENEFLCGREKPVHTIKGNFAEILGLSATKYASDNEPL